MNNDEEEFYVSDLPWPPGFLMVYDANHKRIKDRAEITFNLKEIPDRAWLIACKEALERLIAEEFPTDQSVAAYNTSLMARIDEIYGTRSGQPKPPKAPLAGYVYVIESGGYYKIGRTKNLESRFKIYMTENPLPQRLVVTKKTDDCVLVEAQLLKRFDSKRHRGEWFALNEADLENLKQLLA